MQVTRDQFIKLMDDTIVRADETLISTGFPALTDAERKKLRKLALTEFRLARGSWRNSRPECVCPARALGFKFEYTSAGTAVAFAWDDVTRALCNELGIRRMENVVEVNG